MSPTQVRRSAPREPIPAGAIVFRPAQPVPIAMSEIDEDSYEPLAHMAEAVGRELGGDGSLVTWHEEAAEPRHLFADGACETRSEVACDLAEMGLSAAKLGNVGARSHWRTLRDDPSSGALTTSIPDRQGVITITTLFKQVGRSTRMHAGEAAARLSPFLQAFFRTWLSRLKAVASVRALTSVIDNSDVGVLLVDRGGQLIFVSRHAEELLAQGDGLRRRGRVVVGGSMTDTVRLHAAIDQALAAGAGRSGKANESIVAVRRREGRPLTIAVVPCEDSDGLGADCAAIVYIVDPDQDLQPLIKPVCDFYRLSPVETRLACTLAHGKSVAEAAAQLRVRELTARTYLKQIFLKTDTNRQVELVRLLLLSAVRAGGHPRSATA